MNGLGQHTTVENHLQESPRWFAVYTKYKCEKYVVNALTKKGIKAYIPLLKRVKQYSSRKKTYLIPLINCYVFVEITKEEYPQVLSTEYLFSFVKQGKNMISIPEGEIEILKKVEGSNIEFELDVLQSNIGQRVEVISGNLTGLEGTLVSKPGKKEFIIELQNIAYEMRININPAFLRTIA